jgi:hypothetical protein
LLLLLGVVIITAIVGTATTIVIAAKYRTAFGLLKAVQS